MFGPMALTVIFALGGSLVLALTLIPVLVSLFIKKPPKHHETRLVAALRRAYEPLLDRAMHRRGLVVAGASALFAVGMGSASFLGSEFIPELDEGAIALQVWRLPSVSVDEAARQSGRLEALLLSEFPDEVTTVVSKTGRPEIATDPMGIEMSDVFVMLHPPEEWSYGSKAELIDAMQHLLEDRIPGVALGFSQPIELRVSELIAGVRSEIAIKIFGEDLEELARVADEVAAAVARVPGAVDVKVEQVSGLPILTVGVDRESVARQGLNADDVMDVVEALYNGYGEGFPRGGGPDQGKIHAEGNKYLKADFPKLDYVKAATILE